ncbi:MAG: esterase/lipase family protein, partial [Gammaproteobacteria bacterium]
RYLRRAFGTFSIAGNHQQILCSGAILKHETLCKHECLILLSDFFGWKMINNFSQHLLILTEFQRPGHSALRRFAFSAIVVISLLGLSIPAKSETVNCVVLLHGLWRTDGSMEPLQEAFEARGYAVANVAYPSRKQAVEPLADIAVKKGLEHCREISEGRIHFVTHSLGGILVRYYLARHEVVDLGRIVMLAPPNNGSQAIDNLKELPGFELLMGPAALQLGTGPNDIPAQLGPAEYPVGIIAGTDSLNPILSQYLPNPDDGKVSVSSTRLAGMRDFITLPVSHAFIMRDRTAIRQAVAFIETGQFERDEES